MPTELFEITERLRNLAIRYEPTPDGKHLRSAPVTFTVRGIQSGTVLSGICPGTAEAEELQTGTRVTLSVDRTKCFPASSVSFAGSREFLWQRDTDPNLPVGHPKRVRFRRVALDASGHEAGAWAECEDPNLPIERWKTVTDAGTS